LITHKAQPVNTGLGAPVSRDAINPSLGGLAVVVLTTDTRETGAPRPFLLIWLRIMRNQIKFCQAGHPVGTPFQLNNQGKTMRDVVIASCCRTPIGAFGGSLKDSNGAYLLRNSAAGRRWRRRGHGGPTPGPIGGFFAQGGKQQHPDPGSHAKKCYTEQRPVEDPGETDGQR
jgi:hypothetical protein